MNHLKSSILSVLLVVGVIGFSSANSESYHPPGSGTGGQGSYGSKSNHGSGTGGQGSYGNKPNYSSGTGGQGSYGNKPNYSSGTGGQGSYGSKPNYGSGTGGQGSYGGKPNYGSGGSRPDYGSEGYHACERETERKILRKHESARHIRWDERSVRQWRESSNKTGYRGWGDFVGGKGRGRRYEFQCIYNHKKHRVNSAWVDVKEH